MQRSKIGEDASPATDALTTQSEYSAPTQTVGSTRGVTFRVVLLSLALAAVFGYCIPIVDYKFKNTFLGAAHLPAAAVFSLLVLLVVVNPLLQLVSRRLT